MQIRAFLHKLVYLLPIPIIVVGFNAIVDPANLISGGTYERGLAAILLTNNNAGNVRDCDERLLQMLYAEDVQNAPDILVIGASRTWQIRTNQFPGRTLFNASIPGSVLVDYMAVYGAYRRRGLTPKTVILGLNPWLLNPAFQVTSPQWDVISDNVLYTADIMQLPRARLRDSLQRSAVERYLELISFRYFQASFSMWLKDMRKALRGEASYYPTTDTIADAKIRLADGSLSYDRGYRAKSIEEVNALAVQFGNQRPFYGLNDFETLDASRIDSFERFLRLLLDDGVEVILFLPPYHPKSYELAMRTDQRDIMEAVERSFRTSAQRFNLPIIGSYDPTQSGCDEYDFYDPLHPKESAISKIFKELPQ